MDRVYLEISLPKKETGRLIFELWQDSMPTATSFFESLCIKNKNNKAPLKGLNLSRDKNYCRAEVESSKSHIRHEEKNSELKDKGGIFGILALEFEDKPPTNELLKAFVILKDENVNLKKKLVSIGHLVAGKEVLETLFNMSQSSTKITECGIISNKVYKEVEEEFKSIEIPRLEFDIDKYITEFNKAKEECTKVFEEIEQDINKCREALKDIKKLEESRAKCDTKL